MDPTGIGLILRSIKVDYKFVCAFRLDKGLRSTDIRLLSASP